MYDILTTSQSANPELTPLVTVLSELKAAGKLSLAILYGSFARGTQHCRSDIDLAIAIPDEAHNSEMDILDRILMTTDRPISILRLDDIEESPFVVQEALNGIHQVEPDTDTLYAVADRALHESESIRYRRHRYAW